MVADADPDVAATLAPFGSDPRLRIIANEGAQGASGARNTGVAASLGKIVIFLDDDDEIISDYPARVADVAQADRADWGFSRHFVQTGVQSDLHLAPRKGRRQGLIRKSGPFKRYIAGTGIGFWIRRDLFLALGGFCPELRLDEDTDLCCRLVAASHWPWYEEKCGMIISRDASVVRLTQGTAASRAECYVLTLQRNAKILRHTPGAIAFLALRAQRMLIRADVNGSVDAVYREVPSFWLRLVLRAKLAQYKILHKLQARSATP